jgi:hypothetical protein
VTELRFGGRCSRHPLNIIPCTQCAAEPLYKDDCDIDDLRDMLREMARPTTDAALAKQLGLSPQYLCDVLLGRREPGPKLLRALGLRKEVRYVKDSK